MSNKFGVPVKSVNVKDYYNKGFNDGINKAQEVLKKKVEELKKWRYEAYAGAEPFVYISFSQLDKIIFNDGDVHNLKEEKE